MQKLGKPVWQAHVILTFVPHRPKWKSHMTNYTATEICKENEITST